MLEIFGQDEQYAPLLLEEEKAIVPESELDRREILTDVAAGPEAASAVRSELSYKPSSDVETALLGEFHRRQQEKFLFDMEETVVQQGLTQAQKLAKLTAQAKAMESTPIPTMAEIARERLAATAAAEDENAFQVQEALIAHYEELGAVDKATQEIANTLTWDTNLITQIRDTAIGVGTPWWDQNIKEMINAAVPGFVSPAERLPWPIGGTGDIKVRFKEHLQSLPPKEQVNVIRKLAEAIENNSTYAMNNGYVKMTMWKELVQDLNEANATQTFDNIIGVLDYVGLGIFAGAARLTSMGAKRLAQGAKTTKTLTTAGGTSITMTGGSKVIDELASTLGLKKAEQIVANTTEQKSPTSLAAIAEKVDPEGAATLQKTAIVDETGTLADKLGATRTQMVNDGQMPKMPGTPPGVGPSLNDLDDTMIDIDINRSLYTPDEIQKAQGSTDLNAEAHYERVLQVSPNLLFNKSTVEAIPGGYRANYIIQDSRTRGFSSQKLAEATARTFREFDKVKTKILVRNYKTDEFIDINIAKKEGWFDPKRPNEYAIGMEVEEYLIPHSALADVPIFTGNNVVGKTAAWVDKSATFVNWIVRAGNIASDVKSGKLGAMMRMLKPMTILSDKDQQKILAVLDEGDRAEKWYSNSELRNTIWPDEKNANELVAGYRAVIRHNQAAYRELNKRTRVVLETQGFKHILFDKKIFGKENSQLGRFVGRNELTTIADEGLGVSTAPKEIKQIFDAETGKLVKVDTEALNKLNIPENQFIKLHTPMFLDKQQFQYVVMKRGVEKPSLKIKQLPKYVLNNQEGYQPRVYDAPYILKVYQRGALDGNYHPTLKAFQMYPTKGQMDRDLARLEIENAAKPKNEQVKYVPTPAKELRADEEFANGTSLEYLEHVGALFTSKRGREVLGIDGQRTLKSLSDSLSILRTKAASANTLEPLLEKLTANWEKKYGKLYGVNGKMPFRTEDIQRNSQDLRQTLEYDEAVAFQRHIKMLSGVDDSLVTGAMRQFAINVSDWLSTAYSTGFKGRVANWAAEGIIRNRRRNPINGLKGMAFTHFIIFNPIRQLILQSQQASVYLGVEHGLKYFLGRGIPEYGGLMIGNIWRHTPQWSRYKKIGAKIANMSEDEYETFVDAYKLSGFPSSIDHHMYAVVSNLERTHLGDLSQMGSKWSSPVWHKPWEYFNNIRKYTQRTGFGAGEQTQLMGAFLAARNKWMKNNPKIAKNWHEPDNLQQIAGDARALSLNMNETGALQSQRGLWGMAFQFMSHATKSFQVLIPNTTKLGSLGGLSKFSNKAFSNAEKRNIAAIQFLLYGTGAFGITNLYDKLKSEIGAEVPPEWDKLVQEGINGSLLNLTFAAMGDEESDLETNLELSSTMAPFSGVGGRSQIFGLGNPVGYLIDAMVFNPKELAELIGPGYALGEKATKWLKFTGTILGNVPATELGTMEFGLIADEFGRQTMPIWSNFMVGRSMDLYDRHISASGNVGVEVTDGETWGKFWIGANSKRQLSLQDDLITIRGLMGHPQEEAMMAALNKEADSLYQYVKRRVEWQVQGKYDPELAAKEIERVQQFIQHALEEDEYAYLMDRFSTLYAEDTIGGGVEAQITANLTRMIGKIPSLLDEEFITRLENQPDFRGKEELIKEFKEWAQTSER